MLIVIQATYRGHALPNGVLEAGEHEVSTELGEYLLERFSGPPFHARLVEKKAPLETKPIYPAETKPVQPEAVKRKPGRPRKTTPEPRKV